MNHMLYGMFFSFLSHFQNDLDIYFILFLIFLRKYFICTKIHNIHISMEIKLSMIKFP